MLATGASGTGTLYVSGGFTDIAGSNHDKLAAIIP